LHDRGDGRANAHPALGTDFPDPRYVPLSGHVLLHELAQFLARPQVIQEVMRHQRGGLRSGDAVVRVVRDCRLHLRLLHHLVDGREHADWRRPHRRAALVAVWTDALQKLRAVAHVQQELVERSRVSLSRVALEHGDELLGQLRLRPRPPFDDHLRDRQRHLRVVRVRAGNVLVAPVADVSAQVVLLAVHRVVGVLEAGAVGIRDGQFNEHGNLHTSCACNQISKLNPLFASRRYLASSKR
jgi:hypothetical protein